MEAATEASEVFEIYIGVFGPITSGFFTDLVCDPLNEYLDLVDRSVRASSAVGL